MLREILRFTDRFKAIPMFLTAVFGFGLTMFKSKDYVATQMVLGLPPVEWIVDETHIRNGYKDELFEVTSAYQKLRPDCKIISRKQGIVDVIGFVHDVRASIGVEEQKPGTDKYTRRHRVKIISPKDVTKGLASYSERTTYVCPSEGQLVVEFPSEVKFLIDDRQKENE